MARSQVKLNVGAGGDALDGWTSVDLYVPAHIRAPVWDMPVSSQSVTHLRANHVLEHVPRAMQARTLAEWRRVLQQRGALYVEVPDMRHAAHLWLDGCQDDENVIGAIWGGQSDEGQYHYHGFDRSTLVVALEAAGLWDDGMEVLEVWRDPAIKSIAAQGLVP